MAFTMITPDRNDEHARAETLLTLALHACSPLGTPAVRAALVVRAVVRRTSPTCARIGGEGGRLVFPAAMWGGGGRPS